MRIPKHLKNYMALRYKNDAFHSPSRYEIKGKRIVGMSPIHLPDICVKCGSEEKDGKRVNEILYYGSPLWWLLVFFFNVLAVALIYLVIRKRVKVLSLIHI